MATKIILPNENAWMNITKEHIEDLSRLRWLIRNIFSSHAAVNKFKKLSIIPEQKLNELLKLVNVVVNDDGTMNLGRFLVEPIPIGEKKNESMIGEKKNESMIGEIVSIKRAGKTRRRRKKGKRTTRR